MQEQSAHLLKMIPNDITWVVFLALYDAVKSPLNGPEKLAKVENKFPEMPCCTYFPFACVYFPKVHGWLKVMALHFFKNFSF